MQWRVDFSYANRLGLGVMMVPKRGSELNPLAFQLELTSSGSGQNRRWLVDAWAPNGIALVQSEPPRTRERSQALAASRSPLSANWLLVPLGVVGLVLLVPIGLALRGWFRASRAEREYRARTL